MRELVLLLLFFFVACNAQRGGGGTPPPTRISCETLCALKQEICQGQPGTTIVHNCTGNHVTCNDICIGMAQYCSKNMNNYALNVCVIPYSTSCVSNPTNFQQEIYCDPAYPYYRQPYLEPNATTCQFNPNKAATLAVAFYNQLQNPALFNTLPANVCNQTLTGDTTIPFALHIDCHLPDLSKPPISFYPPFFETNLAKIFPDYEQSFPNNSMYQLSFNSLDELTPSTWNQSYYDYYIPDAITLAIYGYSEPLFSCIPSLFSVFINASHGAINQDNYILETPSITRVILYQAAIFQYYDAFGVSQYDSEFTGQSGTVIYVNRTEVVLYDCLSLGLAGSGVQRYDLGDLLLPSNVNIAIFDYTAQWSILNFISLIGFQGGILYEQSLYGETIYASESTTPLYPNLEYLQLNVTQTYTPSTKKRTLGPLDLGSANFAFNLPVLQVFILSMPTSLNGILDPDFFCNLEVCQFNGYLDYGLTDPGSCCQLNPSASFVVTPTPTPTPTCASFAQNENEMKICDYLYPFYLAGVPATYSTEECQNSDSFTASFLMVQWGTVAADQSAQSANICSAGTDFINFLCSMNEDYYFQVGNDYNLPYPSSANGTTLLPLFYERYGNPNTASQPFGIQASYIYTGQFPESDVYPTTWSQIPNFPNFNTPIQTVYSSYNPGFPLQANCMSSIGYLYFEGDLGYLPNSYGIFNSSFLQVVIIIETQLDDYTSAFGTTDGLVPTQRTQVILDDCILRAGLNKTVNVLSLFSPSLVIVAILDKYEVFDFGSFFDYLLDVDSEPLGPNIYYLVFDIQYANASRVFNISNINWAYHFPQMQTFIFMAPVPLQGSIPDSYFQSFQNCLFDGINLNLSSQSGYCGLPTPCMVDSESFNDLIHCDYMYAYYDTNSTNYNTDTCVVSSTKAATFAVIATGGVTDTSYFESVPPFLCDGTLTPNANVSLDIVCNTNNVYNNFSFLPGYQYLNAGVNEVFYLEGYNYYWVFPETVEVVGIKLTLDTGNTEWAEDIALPELNNIPPQVTCIPSLQSVWIDGGYSYVPNFYNFFSLANTESFVILNAQLDNYNQVNSYAPVQYSSYGTATPRRQMIYYNTVLVPGSEVVDILTVYQPGAVLNFALFDYSTNFIFGNLFDQLVAGYFEYSPDYDVLQYFALSYTNSADDISRIFDLSTINWSQTSHNLNVFYLDAPLKLNGTLDSSFFCNLKLCVIKNYIDYGLNDPGSCCDLEPVPVSTPTPSCVAAANNFDDLINCDPMFVYYHYYYPGASFDVATCQMYPPYAATLAQAAFGYITSYQYLFAEYGTNICNLTIEITSAVIMQVQCNITEVFENNVDSLQYSGSIESVFPNYATLSNNNQTVGLNFIIDTAYVFSSWSQVQEISNNGLSSYATNALVHPPELICIPTLSSIEINGGFYYIPNSFNLFNSTLITSVVVENLQMDDYLTACGTAPGMNGYQRTEVVLINCYISPEGAGPQDLSLMMSASLVIFAWEEEQFAVGLYNYFSQAYSGTKRDGPLAPNLQTLELSFVSSNDMIPIDFSQLDMATNFPNLKNLVILGPVPVTGTLDDAYFMQLDLCSFVGYTGGVSTEDGYCNFGD